MFDECRQLAQISPRPDPVPGSDERAVAPRPVLALVGDTGRAISRLVTAAKTEPNNERRREPRFEPPAAARLGFRANGKAAKIRDLSSGGVQLGAQLGGPGTAVQVAFAGFAVMIGTIAWSSTEGTGVRLAEDALDLVEHA